MKKTLVTILTLVLCAFCALAQTPEEIVNRMDEEMDKHDKSEGIVMTMTLKMPIVGSISVTSYILGDKLRMETETGKTGKITSWSDNVTSWTYTQNTNTVTIENAKPSSGSSSDEDNLETLSNITDGYSVNLVREDDSAWYFTCKKLKDNKDKDAPKTMDLSVRKDNYFPKSLSMSKSGIKVTISDLAYGVTEDQVTFNPEKFPGAKIEDKR